MEKHIRDEQQREGQDYAVALEMASIAEMPIEWLWPGRIVMENLTLLAGEPLTGKSALAIDIAARVTRGSAWPDGTPGGEPKSVLMISAGDHASFTVRPALAAAGADMSKIATAHDARDAKDLGGFRRPLDLPRDFHKLARMIQDRGDCKLVVFDPITAFVRGGGGMRNTLMTLAMMAADLHVAILALTHLRPGGLKAMYRSEGGNALTTAARGVWLAVAAPGVRGQESGVRDQESGVKGDDGSGEPSYTRRLLLPVKQNLLVESTGLAYRLAMAEGRLVSKVEWEDTEVHETADEALSGAAKPTERNFSMREHAINFLRETLAKGPQPVKIVELEAEVAHGIKRRTLERARKALSIRHYRTTAGGPVWIRLPSAKELAEKNRKNGGGVGGQAAKAVNHGTFLPEACPPIGGVGGGVGSGVGGVGEEESGDRGQESGVRSQETGDRSQGMRTRRRGEWETR